ncbi:TerD family protein [Yinghuangia sp. ASG 101]|uniref:TerD family protein n=1 Tax=Yinghuangia sp. ASG 101 TaxID=2896848 RepID=UPI001E402C74|nr:TerD family protein [Yinghuangia sp. ASG 101]UGQ10128.1 TerD family protein [Yinghuangia sp. ASG 101]
MTTELVRGQNLPLPQPQAAVEVTAQCPVELVAVLLDANLKVRDDADVVQRDGTAIAGVAVRPLGVDVDLSALSEQVDRVIIAATLEGSGVDRFGAVVPPVVRVDSGGAAVASFPITDLGTERAIQTVELYRRQGAWKVRALGQGYEGGLDALLRDVGVELRAPIVDRVRTLVAGPAAPVHSAASTARPAVPDAAPVTEPVAPVAGFPTATVPGQVSAPRVTPGMSDAQREAALREARREVERLYEQVWGIFEDAARSAASYRSSVGFADNRLDQDLAEVLNDPAARTSPAGLALQDTARAKHRELVERARAGLDRDSNQLAAEVAQLEPKLPPEMARWDSPAWAAWRAADETALAIRLGDLHLPETPQLRIPMVLRLPMERGLWIDSGASGLDDEASVAGEAVRARATELAVTLAARMLAAFPVGDLKLHVVDPEGKGAAAGPFAPLAASGLLVGPAATTAPEVATLLAKLMDRVELARMAIESGATDALPDHIDFSRQLLVVHGFPYAFDDRTVTQLRHLVEEGPRVGVHVMVVGSRADAGSFGPLLDPLWRAMLRLTPIPEDHIADPWVNHAWTYTPDLPSDGTGVTQTLLSWVASSAAGGR